MRRGGRIGQRNEARSSRAEEVRAAAERYVQEQLAEQKTQERREKIRQTFGQGEIPREMEVEFLRGIAPKVDMADERGMGFMVEEIKDDPEQAQMFAMVLGREADAVQRMTGADMKRFFQVNSGRTDGMDTPVGFGMWRRMIIGQLKPVSDRKTFSQYVAAMNRLEENLYGERFEYYRDMERQNKDARREAERQVGGNVLSAANMAQRSQENLSLEMNSEEKQAELLKRAVIDGDSWEKRGVEYKLTPEILATLDLGPKYATKVGGREIDLSRVYSNDGRDAVVGYVSDDDGVKVRTYYQSRSAGVWRYMPDYVRKGEGAAEFYGKGFGEESVTLPAELQRALDKIQETTPEKGVRTNPDFVFCGTAKKYGSKEELARKLYMGEAKGDFYEEVRSQPMTMEFGKQKGGEKIEPERVFVRAEREPDFRKLVMSYAGENAIAGKMTTEVFRSYDGKLDWLMCADEAGRSWVGGIECESPVTSTGCRSEWVAAGDIATPLYEYGGTQDGGYGDFGDQRGRYLGMWKDYLSKVPLIKKYAAYKQRRG